MQGVGDNVGSSINLATNLYGPFFKGPKKPFGVSRHRLEPSRLCGYGMGQDLFENPKNFRRYCLAAFGIFVDEKYVPRRDGDQVS